MATPPLDDNLVAISDYGKLSTAQLRLILDQAKSGNSDQCLEGVKKARFVVELYNLCVKNRTK